MGTHTSGNSRHDFKWKQVNSVFVFSSFHQTIFFSHPPVFSSFHLSSFPKITLYKLIWSLSGSLHKWNFYVNYLYSWFCRTFGLLEQRKRGQEWGKMNMMTDISHNKVPQVPGTVCIKMPHKFTQIFLQNMKINIFYVFYRKKKHDHFLNISEKTILLFFFKHSKTDLLLWTK